MKPGLFVVAVTAFAAAGFAPAEEDSVRLEGGYALSYAADAQACARACAEDGLCMTWAFAAAKSQCALSAIAPSRAVAAGVASGFSSRAPKFAWAPPPAAAPPQAPPAAIKEAAMRGPFDPDPAATLLGGPDAAGGLRLRLTDEP
jgi:hypothetical protein